MKYNNITIYIIILYMTDYEHLTIDLSGIDISGTGRIIIDDVVVLIQLVIYLVIKSMLLIYQVPILNLRILQHMI